jgi:myo-inositol-1(or 4)-monophosphatase
MSRYPDLLNAVEPIARRAADTLVSMRERKLDVKRKEGFDIVTEADLASEKLIIEGLRALTPEAAVFSEEAGHSGPACGPRWIVDPLDGTINYAAGLPWFSITIAYQEDDATRLGLILSPLAGYVARFSADGTATVNDRPAAVSGTARLADAVVSVVLTSHFSEAEVARTSEIIRRLGSAARGVRVIVSGALELALLASGHTDAFVSLKADIVSHAAGMPLVRAGGGRISRLDGTDAMDDDLEKIGSNGLIHEELLERLNG